VGLLIGLSISKGARRAAQTILGLTSLILVSTLIATIATETLGARGEWHLVSWRLSVFLWVVSIGLMTATGIRSRVVTANNASIVTLGLIPIFFIQGFFLHSELSQRLAYWNAGEPAPIGYISDTEVSWIKGCAQQLQHEN